MSERLARALLAEFPAYDAARFVNSHDRPGKAVYADVRALGPAFRALDDLTSSASFLGGLSRLTGVDGLVHDPRYRGGGAQENRPGMRLWPHIDFNFSGGLGWRRLNLLLYLNERWRAGDGGRLRLHAGPRARPAKSVEPRFNRCVIFETSERSWHSVEPVRGERGRLSVSLYFYTKRPPRATAAPHTTIWEFPGLPRGARAGAVLDEELLAGIRRALVLRDEELAVLERAAVSKAPPALPEGWSLGRTLSAADAAWLRAELERRSRRIEELARPFKTSL